MATLYMAWRGVDDDQDLWWAVSHDGKRWSRQLPLTDRASIDAPALAAFQNKLFMAWRGAGDDDNLWWATYDGNADLKWSDQQQLTDRASTEGPALAVFQNKLYMAWRGFGGVVSDESLYWATYDENDPRNRKWTDQHPLGRASFDVPALAAFQDKLFMAWRGVEGDENLYWGTYDGNPDLNWSTQNPPLTDRASTVGPALAVFQNKLYMVWKGAQGIDENDERLFWATYDENDPRKWTDQSKMERATADQTGTVVFGSVHRPSLAVFLNSISVAGAGFNTVTSTGAPDPGNAENLNPVGPDGGAGPLDPPDDDGGSNPPPLEPKGLFYFNFDGEIPSLPILLFPDRASEKSVTQAVYADIPISMKKVMLRHGFDPSKGFKEFIREFNLVSSVTLRPLVGF